jgi:hypothetical protein
MKGQDDLDVAVLRARLAQGLARDLGQLDRVPMERHQGTGEGLARMHGHLLHGHRG